MSLKNTGKLKEAASSPAALGQFNTVLVPRVTAHLSFSGEDDLKRDKRKTAEGEREGVRVKPGVARSQ